MKQSNEWEVLVKKLQNFQKDSGITNAELSRSTGIQPQNITRFYSLNFKPKLDTFLKIGNAVGVKTDIFLTENECNTFDIKKKPIELKGDSLRK